jgi:hypothetical protein
MATILPRLYLSNFIRESALFLFNSGKNILVALKSSGLDFHLWFHFLYIALEIFTIAVLFGGGNSTLFSSFALPVLAKKSAISLPV